MRLEFLQGDFGLKWLAQCQLYFAEVKERFKLKFLKAVCFRQFERLRVERFGGGKIALLKRGHTEVRQCQCNPPRIVKLGLKLKNPSKTCLRLMMTFREVVDHAKVIQRQG